MALETTKHFDAPQPPGIFETSVRLVGNRWGSFVALVFLLAFAFFAASAVVTVRSVASVDRAAALRATTAAVVLDPQTTAADAEAVGALVRSIPGVGEATFRSKDEALKDLASRGMPPPDGRNPLPDVWLMRMQPDDRAAPAGSRFAAAAKAAGALPHVASVRFDPRWADRLDRADAARRDLVEPLSAAVLSALGVLCLASGLLGAGALAFEEGASRAALGVTTAFAILLAAGVASGAVYGVVRFAANRTGAPGVEASAASAWAAASPFERPLESAPWWAAGAGLAVVGALSRGASRR